MLMAILSVSLASIHWRPAATLARVPRPRR